MATREFVTKNRSKPWPHNSTDPTATKTIRDNYAAEMYHRFRALKGAIREGIVANDALGIGRGPRTNAALSESQTRDFEAMARPDIEIEPPEPGMFQFPSDERKVQEFENWLDTQVDRGILERHLHQGRDLSARKSWQNTYIRSAYEKGVNHADQALVNEGMIPPSDTLEEVFRPAKHADSAGLLYTRAFRELDGVTSAMGQQISRELTEGLTQGENPRKIGRRLNDRVDKIGLTRGRLIARTEVIRAHNEGTLNRYEDFESQIGGVRVLAEHVTAGDERVCPECMALEGRRFSLENARGRIPVHPRCRCTWVPIQTPDQPAGEPRGAI